MTTIDTLLTLDADDPALRRGIAEMLGYHLVDQEEGWIIYPPPDAPREVEDRWRYDRVHLKPEDAWPTAMTMLPDWPHSVDAALTLLPPLPSAIIISRVIEGWYVGINTMSSRLRDISEGRSDNLALAICRAWLASKR